MGIELFSGESEKTDQANAAEVVRQLVNFSGLAGALHRVASHVENDPDVKEEDMKLQARVVKKIKDFIAANKDDFETWKF